MNLLAKDVLGSDKNVLAPVVNFLTRIQQVVKCFKKSSLLLAELVQKQKAENKRSLQLQAPTRWGSMLKSCQTVLESEAILLTIATSRHFLSVAGKAKEKRATVQATISGGFCFVGLRIHFL